MNIVGGNKSSTLGLIKTFEAQLGTPVKSSFSEFRRTISYNFFEEIFNEQASNFSPQRPTWRGFNVFAVDGDNYLLPANGDTLNAGYRGPAVKGDREGYYPRMYVSTLYDVLSGTIVDFTESTKNDELARAMHMMEKLDQENILVLYDRLYFSKKLVTEHLVAKTHFLCRLKVGETVLTEVKKFFESGRSNQTVDIEGEVVHLVRVQNPTTGEDSFFATNMDRSKFKNKEIIELYSRRWDIETSFRDLTETLEMDKWHTKFINGIKQEIFVTLWIFNQIKMWELEQSPRSWHRKLKREYKRPCFKSLYNWFTDYFVGIGRKLTQRAIDEFKLIIKRTMETRKRLARNYPRASKQPAKRHSSHALVKKRN